MNKLYTPHGIEVIFDMGIRVPNLYQVKNIKSRINIEKVGLSFGTQCAYQVTG